MTKDELFDYLNSDANEFGFNAVATHGFLSASVVGKPLPNWLHYFFEENDDKVADDIKAALSAWRDELIDTLKNEEPIELPFYDDEELDLSDDGDIVAWSIGFVDAMYASETHDWFDDADTEEDVADLTLPMVVLSGIADEDEELAAMRQDEDIMIDLVNSIEENLTQLYLLFHIND